MPLPALEARWEQLGVAPEMSHGSTWSLCPRQLHTIAMASVPVTYEQTDPDRLSLPARKDVLVVFGGKSKESLVCAHQVVASEYHRCPLSKHQQLQTTVDFDVFLGDLKCFDVERQQWMRVIITTTEAAPCPRAYHTMNALGNSIIICGGKGMSVNGGPHHREESLSDVWRGGLSYCATTDTLRASWESLYDATLDTTPNRNVFGGFAYHTSALLMMPSLSPTHLCNEEPYLVVYGGCSNTHFNDVVSIFSLEQRVWSHPAIVPRASTTSPSSSVSLTGPQCTVCGSRFEFCAHKSPTLRSAAIRRKLRSTKVCLRAGEVASMPPRDGHSMTYVPTVASPWEGTVAEACCRHELMLFGGEVALTTFNTLLKLVITTTSASTQCSEPCSNVSAEWCVVSGGRELPPPPTRFSSLNQVNDTISSSERSPSARVIHSDAPCDQQEQPHSSADSCQTLTTKEADCRDFIVVSESPERPHRDCTPQRSPTSPGIGSLDNVCCSTQRSSHNGSEERWRREKFPHRVAPGHRAFHCAWSSGSTGVLIYGGILRERILDSMYYFDRLTQTWHHVVNPSRSSPGPRGSAAYTSEALSSSGTDHVDQYCQHCHAPVQCHYLCGGEDIDGAVFGDVWRVAIHFEGCCREAAVLPHSAPLQLTPPPKRRGEQPLACHSAAPICLDDESTLTEATTSFGHTPRVSLLPLKVILGLLVKQRFPSSLTTKRH